MKKSILVKSLALALAILMLLPYAVPASATTAKNEQGYAVNAKGQTYGNLVQAQEIGYEPELILLRVKMAFLDMYVRRI